MSVFHNMMLAGAGSQGGGASSYQIARSLRFNSADSAYLSRTPSSAGNRKTWTWAGWVKRSALGTDQILFSAGPLSGSGNATGLVYLFFTSSNTLNFALWTGSTTVLQVTSSAVYRDTGAWYHVVAVLDTDNATSSERVRLYVNGARLTSLSSAQYPSSGATFSVNNTQGHNIGRYVWDGTLYLNGYLADVHFIDGQALTPSSFGETDSNGVWQPKAYSGTYGTNGFRLDFSDNSSATSTGIGKDASGNGNNWTPTNFSVSTSNVNYSATGTISGTGFNTGGPIGNVFDGSTSTRAYANQTGYATYTFASPVTVSSSLRIYASSNQSGAYSSFYVNGNIVSIGGAGWYTINGVSSLQSFTVGHGAASISDIYAIEVDGSILVDNAGIGNDSLVDSPTNYGTDTGAGGEVRGNYCTLNPLSGLPASRTLSNGSLDIVTSTGSGSFGTTLGTIAVNTGKWYWEYTCVAYSSVSDFVFGIAPPGYTQQPYQGDSYVYFGYDGNKANQGTSSAYGSSYTNGDIIGVAFNADSGSITFYKNGVSQGVAFTGISGTYAPLVGDTGSAGITASTNFGQRPFAYAAPSGFKALCTQNLPTPTIPNGRTAMDVVTYTGNGGTQTISGLGFAPDLVWIKHRGAGYGHRVFDIVRGTGTLLYTNLADAEVSQPNANDNFASFDSGGFSLGAGIGLNENNGSFVAWTWDAGTSTVTNTAGTITSQVRANASAGISIVSWTGTTTGTIGHGLGVAPSLIIAKSRSSAATGWIVYSKVFGTNYYLILNQTDAVTYSASYWGSSDPSSSTFGVIGTGFWNNNGSMIAYCFAPVSGFSAFGSYTGNGSADGVFVYTGFRPRWIMLKWYSGTISNPSNAVWLLFDSAREPANKVSKYVSAESSAQEYSDASIDFLSNGFKLRDAGDATNRSAGNYIYAAFSENPFSIARAR